MNNVIYGSSCVVAGYLALFWGAGGASIYRNPLAIIVSLIVAVGGIWLIAHGFDRTLG